MDELPLFPLNTVLFPGAPLHLHIFEERYKQMINECLHTRRPFGVVLIKQGQEALGPLALPHTIGCTAQIFHVHRLGEGRMNIAGMGIERIRILTIDSKSHPYLVGWVQPHPFRTVDPQVSAELEPTLRRQVQRFISLLQQAGSSGQAKWERIPEDALKLACMAAALLPASPHQKQELLNLDRGDDLLYQVSNLYRRETALLRDMLCPRPVQEGAFSIN